MGQPGPVRPKSSRSGAWGWRTRRPSGPCGAVSASWSGYSADRLEIEPVKAEALRELEEITERLRKSPWLSRHGAERCARAVAAAIKRLQSHLAGAVDAEGKPDEVLQAFALHLQEHLLIPSGRGCGHAGKWLASVPAGCFTYVPPATVVWEVQSLKSKRPKSGWRQSKVQSPTSKVWRLAFKVHVPALPRSGYLSRFSVRGFALALLATGCAGPARSRAARPSPRTSRLALIEQTLVQGENPAQASKQTRRASRCGPTPCPQARESSNR